MRDIFRTALALLAAVSSIPTGARASEIVPQAYLKAPSSDAGDFFGWSVAASGDTIVVGAWAEDGAATGANGDPTDNGAITAGAAYVFARTGANWSLQAYLKPSNTDADDEFGFAVAISGDTVVIGAHFEDSGAAGVNGDANNNGLHNAGAAYVFTRNGTTWSQQAYLKASNPVLDGYFGASVAISGDTVVVGAPLESSGATGVDGDQLDTSALASGAAYVFTRSGTTWSQQAYLKASNTGANDHFGSAVAVAGDSVVVGASGEDSNAINVGGDQGNNGAADSGAAYVFTRIDGTWLQQVYLKASNTGANDAFSGSLAISNDTIVVGARYEDGTATGVNGIETSNGAVDSGAAYIFERFGTTWRNVAYLKASNTGAGDGFGVSVAVFGESIAVGAQGEDSSAVGVNGNQADNSLSIAGAAYLFSRSGASWATEKYLKATNSGLFDNFGTAVAISTDFIIVTAALEDGGADGVNGDASDNNAPNAGAAYVYDFCSVQATATAYGAGKPGTVGVPSLISSAAPKLGALADLTIAGGLPHAAPVLLVAGYTPATIPFDGGMLLVNPSCAILLPPLDGSGASSVRIPIATTACGVQVYFQAMFFDAGAAGAFHTTQTPGVQWTIGG